MLNRSDQPRILEPEQLVVQRPERIKLPNGVPLSVLNAGDNEVTRIDLLMAGGDGNRNSPCRRCLRTACFAREPDATMPPR